MLCRKCGGIIVLRSVVNPQHDPRFLVNEDADAVPCAVAAVAPARVVRYSPPLSFNYFIMVSTFIILVIHLSFREHPQQVVGDPQLLVHSFKTRFVQGLPYELVIFLAQLRDFALSEVIHIGSVRFIAAVVPPIGCSLRRQQAALRAARQRRFDFDRFRFGFGTSTSRQRFDLRASMVLAPYSPP